MTNPVRLGILGAARIAPFAVLKHARSLDSIEVVAVAEEYHPEQHLRRYAKKHGVERIVQHFTPTSSSWMNLVERFFRDVTQEVIREGSFGHVQELIDDIELYLEQRNADPRPYRWNAKGEEILAKIQKARQKLNQPS